MPDDPLTIALEDVAVTGLRRGDIDVYRYAMGAIGLLNQHAIRHRPAAEAVLDGCRTYLAKKAGS